MACRETVLREATAAVGPRADQVGAYVKVKEMKHIRCLRTMTVTTQIFGPSLPAWFTGFFRTQITKDM